jgi:hypothetical protein
MNFLRFTQAARIGGGSGGGEAYGQVRGGGASKEVGRFTLGMRVGTK